MNENNTRLEPLNMPDNRNINGTILINLLERAMYNSIKFLVKKRKIKNIKIYEEFFDKSNKYIFAS